MFGGRSNFDPILAMRPLRVPRSLRANSLENMLRGKRYTTWITSTCRRSYRNESSYSSNQISTQTSRTNILFWWHFPNSVLTPTLLYCICHKYHRCMNDHHHHLVENNRWTLHTSIDIILCIRNRLTWLSTTNVSLNTSHESPHFKIMQRILVTKKAVCD